MLGHNADLLGASSSVGRLTHNQLHHGDPNVVGVDSDISQALAAAPLARLAPGNRGDRGIVTSLPRRPRPPDFALVLEGKLAHVTWALEIPLMFYPWWPRWVRV